MEEKCPTTLLSKFWWSFHTYVNHPHWLPLPSRMASIPSLSQRHEPVPRFSHCAATVGRRCYLWGGFVQDFSESGGRKFSSTIEVFDPYLEIWEKHNTTGMPPPGLCDGVCTALLESLYCFGGQDGEDDHNSLHRLDTTTLKWRELRPLNQSEGPMRKVWCGMVSFFQDQLAIFGGYGIPTGPIQPGATFIKDNFTSGRGCSNELHVFDITRSMWALSHSYVMWVSEVWGNTSCWYTFC